MESLAVAFANTLGKYVAKEVYDSDFGASRWVDRGIAFTGADYHGHSLLHYR